MFSKSICSIKKTLVVSDLVLTRWGSENIFDRPWAFKCKIETTNSFMMILYKSYNFHFMTFFFEIISCLIKNSSPSQLCSFCIYLSLLFLYFLTELYLAHTRFLSTPCRFVLVLILVRDGLREHSKSSS